MMGKLELRVRQLESFIPILMNLFLHFSLLKIICLYLFLFKNIASLIMI